MKLDLSKILTHFNGRTMMTNKSDEEVKEEIEKLEKANEGKKDKDKIKVDPILEKPLTVEKVCDDALLNVQTEKNKLGEIVGLEDVPRTERLDRYRLAIKIRKGGELDSGEITKLKDLIALAWKATIISSQMEYMLEGKPIEHGNFKPIKNDG